MVYKNKVKKKKNILYNMISETLRKLFKFNLKHHIEFESNLSLGTAPVSEKAPIK